jgi:hypothetical protein
MQNRLIKMSKEERIWTTGRYATAKTRRKAEDLASSSNSKYVARGKKTVFELVDYARAEGVQWIMLVEQNAQQCIEVLPMGNFRWVE